MPRSPTVKRLWNRLLSFDSSIDAGMYGLSRWFGDKWVSYTEIADRMRISGIRRIVVDLTSDALTTGTAAVVLIYAWGLPDAPSEKLLYSGAQQYSVVFTDANGTYLGRRGVLHSNAVPLDEIPDEVIEAVLATEDARFYQHFGIDILGTFRALAENVKANDIVQGGSTLTQQVAKNLFLTPERSIRRKVKEAFLSLWMEARLTKRQILKLYLDRAYMGGGTFGIEAAAEFYFNKSIRDVTLPEAVMLAGLFKAPTRFAPHHNLPAARARANVVLQRMVDAGFITDGQARVVRLHPADLVAPSATYTPEYYLDWAFNEVKRIVDGKAHVLSVKTTLNLKRQKQADEAVQFILRQNGKAKGVSEAALVSMELDGAVQAMIGGRDYGESQFNRAVSAKRQPGSSFKPFVYLTALKEGFTPKSIVVDGPITIGNWSPKNYSRRYRGRVTLATALQKSINVIPVKLAQVFGRKKIAATARALGIRTELRLNRSMPLGTNEVTVLDMTAGYTVFANGGMEAKPYGVLEIRTQDGELIYDRKRDEPPPKRLVELEKIEQLNSMLGGVVTGGTARRAQLGFTPAAGKTGTTQAYRDAWFMGFTGELSTGVWMGNDGFSPTKRLTGGNLPAMIWKKYMAVAHSDQYMRPIPGIKPYGTPRPVVSEAEKQRLVAARKISRAKRHRSIEALNRLTDLFERGSAGPIEQDRPEANLNRGTSTEPANALRTAVRVAGEANTAKTAQ